MTSLILAALAHQPSQPVQALYEKTIYQIPMRDGTKLYTSVYTPKKPGNHPILLERTPYGSQPYGEKSFPGSFDGSDRMVEEGFIFAVQDVRGCYMSEGEFVDVRPILSSPVGVEADESTDAYDTIDYLVKHVPRNNGRVGIWGTSYPGFYAAAAGIRSHPALKAISPQAPVTDWWRGDDDHHNGAFFLQDCFMFNAGGFGWQRTGPSQEDVPGLNIRFSDAYDFFLKVGPVSNLETNFLKGKNAYFTDVMNHEGYDEWWQARDLGRQMEDVKCAVLTVGGLFDAEDLYGPYNIHRNVAKFNPKTENLLVMGPWSHGGWFGSGRSLGGFEFGADTGEEYREKIEFPFFRQHLLDGPAHGLPRATVFETGSNRWRKWKTWPPVNRQRTTLYLDEGRRVVRTQPKPGTAATYISDPAKPVPYTIPAGWRGVNYMIEDQRKFDELKGIAAFQTDPFETPWHVAGPVEADLWVKTTGSDADFIVKVIDVHPDGRQMLVRWEVMRGKFRQDKVKGEPFIPDQPTRVIIPLNDTSHCFLKGHRLMVRVQSSMFPLIDRNPQTFVNIRQAKESDFVSSEITILSGGKHASALVFGVVPGS